MKNELSQANIEAEIVAFSKALEQLTELKGMPGFFGLSNTIENERNVSISEIVSKTATDLTRQYVAGYIYGLNFISNYEQSLRDRIKVSADFLDSLKQNQI
jgi:hypothetical protein